MNCFQRAWKFGKSAAENERQCSLHREETIGLGARKDQPGRSANDLPQRAPQLRHRSSAPGSRSSELRETFLFHTWEDSAVKVENTLEFAAALRKNGVSFALHIYPKGRHGIGLGTSNWDPAARHPWTTECALGLKDQGFGK